MVRRTISHVIGAFRSLTATERLLLLGIFAIHAIGIGWGLPASDGWDVDGIAPRDFLPGIVKTLTPGDYFTYPPLHLLILTVLTLPVTLVTLARAPSLSKQDVVRTFLDVPVMTTFALVARIVALLMSIGVVLAMGRMAGALFGRRARPWAMAFAGLEAAGTYYAHTSNLDIPALFWASWALSSLVDAVQADEPRRLRRVGVLAACAIATKDQAYAVFALSLPIVIVAWAVLRLRASRGVRDLVRESAITAVLIGALVLVMDGALFNPTGFLARVRFLTGPASQDFAQYSKDWPGRLAALKDALSFLPHHYPVSAAPFFLAGVAIAIGRFRGNARLAALIPLLAALSFVLTFNCVARRVEERFMLPQMQLLAVYGGGAMCALLESALVRRSKPLRVAVVIAGILPLALGARMSAMVIATMFGDARYDAERFLDANVGDGDVIEVYGRNVYLPRFPRRARVERVDASPPDARNPMPGILEKQDRFAAVHERAPRWIVVNTGYAWRFLVDSHADAGGRRLPEILRTQLADTDAAEHIQSLFAGRSAYRVAHVAHYEGSWLLPPRHLHASLATDVWIFERASGHGPR